MGNSAFGKILRLARDENRQVRGVNEFLNTNFVIENDFARDSEGSRGWKLNFVYVVRDTKEIEIKSIGQRALVNKTKYLVFVEIVSGGGYWVEPDVDWNQVGEFDTLEDALFQAWLEEKKMEFHCKQEADAMANMHFEEPIGDLALGCRDCGGDSQRCIYCDECAEKKTCHHKKKLGECSECEYESDLAYTASRER